MTLIKYIHWVALHLDKLQFTILAKRIYDYTFSGFSRRAGDRRFSPCTKAYHAGCKFWIHFIFGTTLNVSTIETKRFLLSARKCSENAGYAVFRGSMPPDPPRCSNFSPYFNFISSYYATLGRTLHFRKLQKSKVQIHS